MLLFCVSNEEEIKHGQASFKAIANIIYKIWEYKWTCRECALYRKKKGFIVRTVKRIKSESKSGTKDKVKKRRQWEKNKQKFPTKVLNCIPKEKDNVECIDPQFGIFEI